MYSQGPPDERQLGYRNLRPPTRLGRNNVPRSIDYTRLQPGRITSFIRTAVPIAKTVLPWVGGYYGSGYVADRVSKYWNQRNVVPTKRLYPFKYTIRRPKIYRRNKLKMYKNKYRKY